MDRQHKPGASTLTTGTSIDGVANSLPGRRTLVDTEFSHGAPDETSRYAPMIRTAGETGGNGSHTKWPRAAAVATSSTPSISGLFGRPSHAAQAPRVADRGPARLNAVLKVVAYDKHDSVIRSWGAKARWEGPLPRATRAAVRPAARAKTPPRRARGPAAKLQSRVETTRERDRRATTRARRPEIGTASTTDQLTGGMAARGERVTTACVAPGRSSAAWSRCLQRSRALSSSRSSRMLEISPGRGRPVQCRHWGSDFGGRRSPARRARGPYCRRAGNPRCDEEARRSERVRGADTSGTRAGRAHYP
jgi:hypothetical protein